MQTSDQPKKLDAYAALRMRSFAFYASAWTAGVIGTQVQAVALQWDLYRRTGDEMVLGWIGLIQAIPVMALALPAGHIADRFSRKHILICTQTLAAIAAVGLVVCSRRPDTAIWVYYLLLLLQAIAQAIGWPARTSIIPSLVPMEALPNAVMWNSSFFQFASVIGPAIGGFVVLKSLSAAYSLNVLCQIWYVLCLMMIQPRQQTISREPTTIRTLLAGIAFVKQQRIILATITLDLFAVLLGGATYLLPAVSEKLLKSDALGFGMLRAAPAVGAIIMGLILAHRAPMQKAGKAMLWAVAGFGAATIVFGLSRNFWLSLFALAMIGALDNISVVVRHTLVQVLTPDSMRGRVSAVNNVFIGASNELGGFESGLTARLFGLVTSIVGGGIGTLLVVAGIDRLFPEVRALGTLTGMAPAGEAKGESAKACSSTE